ncbi:MAG: hypothetical protein M3N46_04715 [Actinomycetota bacterium]|nr:hypothetical protein [Actinomycetota bacterium]
MTTTTPTSDETVDPRSIRIALHAVEAALAESADGAALLKHAQAWVAAQLEERLEGAVAPLLPYVRENWARHVEASGGIPLLEYLCTTHLQQGLWAVFSAKDSSAFRDHQNASRAVELLFRACRNADASTARAQLLVERDLRTLRAEEREEAWLRGDDWS